VANNSESPVIEYASPANDAQSRRQRTGAIVVLTLGFLCASAIVAAAASLMIEWTRIAHVRTGCGTPKATIRDTTIMLAIPFVGGVMCWGGVSSGLFGLLKRVLADSLIVACVAWIASMWWTHWY
jgi:hypothetical protein